MQRSRDWKTMHYVLFSSDGAEIVTSWAEAQDTCRSRRYLCKSFKNRASAESFKASVTERLARQVSQECYTDGSARLNQKAAGAAYFGRNDPRNRAELLPKEPFTAPRAEFWAAVLALRASRPLCIVTDSELLFRAFAEGFPTTWANQDLCEELRRLGGESTCRWVPGHKGIAGNEAAHRLCGEALDSATPRAPAAPCSFY